MTEVGALVLVLLAVLGALGGVGLRLMTLSREWTKLEGRVQWAEERHKDLLTEHRALKKAHYRLADAFREAFGGQIKILRLPGAGASDDSDEG